MDIRHVDVMKWSEMVWEKSLRIYDSILDEPFIKELAEGTLSNERFARYIAQDELYLANYGRQMYELADLMTDPQEHEFFKAFAVSGMEGEKQMHQLLIDRFSIDTVAEPSIVTSSYNAHTQRALDTQCREIAIAAMMPCMWIYNRVGLRILEVAKMEGNPFREWIEEYGNEEFTAGVEKVVEMVDAWAEGVDADVLDKMTGAYLEGALYEYAFWDYGYRGEEGDYGYMDRIEEWI